VADLKRWAKKIPRMTDYEKSAEIIETFLEGRSGKWDWDDFTSIKKKDAYLESVRLRCISIHDDFPPKERSHYCSPEGMIVLRTLAREVRKKKEPNQALDPTAPSGRGSP